MWEENDKNGFEMAKNTYSGQISTGKFADTITDLTKDTNNMNFLEIGTWNGLGSTKIFANELILRLDNYVFYSLECNSEKAEFARSLYDHLDKVHILNEVLFNDEPENFYNIFPQCQTYEMYKKWHTIDMENMKRCNLFLERKDLPDIFDVVLLDGGEFTTYFEFQLIKDRCKYLLLDDINVAKCTKIVEEIKSEPEKWKIIEENKTERNGYLVCKNLNNC
jgi:hypothetical protein